MSRLDAGFEKQITFNTQGDGDWFAETIDITPRSGGGLAKIAGEMHPQISKFIRILKPDPAYQYVLMTPMGSYEYWGMNVNGDVFPECSLSYDHHKGSPEEAAKIARKLEADWLLPHGRELPPDGFPPDFGHRTFEEALRYRHHINKDPTIAYGDIPLAVWNDRMHRVEVIVRHDRDRAKRVGADEIIRDLDEGKPRQISMGCRVKFDVCTVCGNISRTQHDYCEHLSSMMGQILPDGRVVGAVNFFPRFFDLSDVIVPAGKESGVLMKVAHLGGRIPGMPNASVMVPRSLALRAPNQLIKTASHALPMIKRAKDKRADIEKKILPNSGYALARRVADSDGDLPKETLEGGDLKKLLTTLALLGIILKPREFQHAAIHRTDPGLADGLWSHGLCFRHRPAVTPVTLNADDFSADLASMISPLIPQRSAFAPHVGGRALRITLIKQASVQVTPAQVTEVDGGQILQKTAEAYSSYRDAVGRMAGPLDVVVQNNLGYYQDHFFGDLLDRAFTKTASVSDRASTRELTAGYLCSAFRDAVCSDLRTRSFGLPTHSPASTLLGH